MSAAPVDYDALAKQSGAISSAPPPAPTSSGVDYAALAKASGAISSTPPPVASPQAEPSVGGFVKNAVTSTGNLIGNAAHALIHPVDTVKAIAQVGVGAANEYIPGNAELGAKLGATPEEAANDSAMFHAFTKNLADRYGSLDNFKHTLYTDPAGVLADVSAIAGGVSGAARGVGAVADLAGAADLASGASKVAQVASKAEALTNPISLAGKTAAAAAGGVAKVTGLPDAGELASRLYQSALKPSLSAKNAPKVPGIVAAGLEHGIPVSAAGADKLSGLIDDVNTAIKARIDAGTAAGVTIDPQAVAARVDQVRPRFANQVNPVADLNAIDNSKAEFLQKNSLAAVPPRPTGVLDASGNMVMTPGTPAQSVPIPADVAQGMKQNTYAQLRNSFGMLSSAEIESQKALARGLKEELVTAFPEIADLNAKESKMIDLEGALRRALPRLANKDMLGIGTPVAVGAASAVTGGVAGAAKAAFVLKSLLDNPVVKSHLALALDYASKFKTPALLADGASTVKQAATVGSRIDAYKAGLQNFLTQQQQLQPAVP